MSPRGVTAYSQVNATVRALYSMMLSSETWEDLTQAQDFDAVLNVLSETVYGAYLEIERAALTPRRTVYQLEWHLADAYEKLIGLTPEPGRQLLLQLWRLYEVDNLKAALRGIEAGASWDQIRHLLRPMVKYTALTLADMERMVHTGDMVQAIERTKHTSYYDILVHALGRYQAERSLFPLEVALDLQYRRNLWHTMNQLTGLDHEKALLTVGTVMDVDNLMWAIRYRVYHHLSEEEIINYTLPFGYKVRDEDIRAIAAGAEIAQVVKRVYPGIDGLGQFSEEPSAGLTALETIFNRQIVDASREALRGYPFHVGVPVAYLLLNEHEIRDLTVLIEAKASRLPTETYARLLEIQPKSDMADQR